MFIRAKIVKNEMYFSLVQGYRDEAGRVRHRTIISLGRCDEVDWAIDEATRTIGRCRRRLKRLEGAELNATLARDHARLTAKLAKQKAYRAHLRELAKSPAGLPQRSGQP